MNRYIRACGCAAIGISKYVILKIERGSNFSGGVFKPHITENGNYS